MGDSLLMTHVHTGSGSRLPASTLAVSSSGKPDMEGEMEKDGFKHKGFHHLWKKS